MLNKKNILTGIKLVCIILVAAFCIFGYMFQLYNLFLMGIVLLLIYNIISSLEHFREEFVPFLFYIMIFTFLVARPLAYMLSGKIWWTDVTEDPKDVWFALFAVLFSTGGIYLGTLAGRYLKKRTKWFQKEKVRKNQEVYLRFRENLQFVSHVLFYLTMIFFMIKQIEPLSAIGQHNYLSLYSDFKSNLPDWFHTIASFMKYSLCIFLATLPNKRKSFIALSVFVISEVPSLMIGARNPIMLNCIFAVVYYLLRDCLHDEEKWFKGAEKTLLFVGAPFALIFMTLYSYIREGDKIGHKSPFALLFAFFNSQGYTFNVLQIGYAYQGNVENRSTRCYTFGGMIDYIMHGNLGQKIFGTQPLTQGNSEINGLYSNSLAHGLSYFTMYEEYLSGRGLGSSYILETYYDWGWPGIILFSIAFGILLILLVNGFRSNILLNTIILISLTQLFFIPRAEAMGWITFVVTIQFWACVLTCYLGAFVCTKIKFFQMIIDKLNKK